MSKITVNTNIEILGKIYSFRCPEQDVASLKKAAELLNERMLEIQKSSPNNLERIAILAGLDIAHQMIDHDQQKTSWVGRINQHLSHLQERLDSVLNKTLQSELIYTTD